MDIEIKLDKLLTKSNPEEVYKPAKKIIHPHSNFELNLSTRKNNKYMIRGEFTNNKWVHFGNINYEDYTFHKDKRRLDNFRKRNSKWGYSNMDTPSFLSFYLLW